MVSPEHIALRIVMLRGSKVLLDSDLAGLYGVETKALNLAVKRNAGRFPADFMFQLAAEEAGNLRFQIETSSSTHGGRRYRPYAQVKESPFRRAFSAGRITNAADGLKRSQSPTRPTRRGNPPA